MKKLINYNLLFFSLLLSSHFINSQTGTKKHNILFISVDDFRPKINSYGESQMITPNIDKLASEGLQFNNAFTNIAVCGASRASIMTGIRPSQNRFNDYTSRASKDTPNAISLNQLFIENGYETISYGKYITTQTIRVNIGLIMMAVPIKQITKILKHRSASAMENLENMAARGQHLSIQRWMITPIMMVL